MASLHDATSPCDLLQGLVAGPSPIVCADLYGGKVIDIIDLHNASLSSCGFHTKALPMACNRHRSSWARILLFLILTHSLTHSLTQTDSRVAYAYNLYLGSKLQKPLYLTCALRSAGEWLPFQKFGSIRKILRQMHNFWPVQNRTYEDLFLLLATNICNFVTLFKHLPTNNLPFCFSLEGIEDFWSLSHLYIVSFLTLL